MKQCAAHMTTPHSYHDEPLIGTFCSSVDTVLLLDSASMNPLSRRYFTIWFGATMASTSTGLVGQRAWAQTSKPAPALKPTPVTQEQLLFSLRALIEVCCREAIEEYRDRLPLSFAGHVRKIWEGWILEDKTAANTPFLRFEVFDELSRHVVKLLWEEALHHFMQKAHVLNAQDLRVMLTSVGTGHVIGTPWATSLLERKARDNIHSRLLPLVLEIELHWLVTQTERYRNNPPARHGQLDTPEHEVALRITRALISTLIEEVATRERYWREQPTPEDPPLAVKPILLEIAKLYREPSPDAPKPATRRETPGKLAITR
jgi:hypothetical protein